MRGIFLRWVCICAARLLFVGPATGAALAAGKPFVAPVNAEVTRKFEAPSHKFGPGHRGIDYGVPPGTTVRASGEGTVTFAGRVADDGLFVTIEHLGGISTTYSFLSQIDVSKGDRVSQGQAIALSGEGHGGGPAALHFGAKKNGDYIDPEVLLMNLDDITDILALMPDEAGGGRNNLAAFQNVNSPTASMGVGGPGVVPGHLNVPFEPGSVRPTESKVPGSLEIPSEGIPLNEGLSTPKFGSHSVPSSGPIATEIEKVRGGGPSRSSVALGVRTDLDDWLSKFGSTRERLLELSPNLIKPTKRKLHPPTGGIPFKEKLARWADKAGDFSLRYADNPSLAMLAPPVGGAFKEAACWLRGGRAAPNFNPSWATLPSFPREWKKGPLGPPNGHVVVAVAGITTQTESMNRLSALYQDSWWESLGYNLDDVYYFSYKGMPKSSEPHGRPEPFEHHDPYTKEHSYQFIDYSAAQLQTQIEMIQRQHPGRQIDLVAHSQGGVVSQYYLANLYRPKKGRNYPSIANFVSISSPHLGTEGAKGYRLLTDTEYGRMTYPGIEPTTESAGLPRGSAPSSQQLDPDSAFMEMAARDWDPTKVNATTIATPFDLAVMPQNTRLAGARHYTVMVDPFSAKLSGHHSSIIGEPGTKAIVYNALRGTPSRCTGFMNVFADEISGEAIGGLQTNLLKGLDLIVNYPWN
jgi:pimeloyl-ACP methyl ester carboxylesterase